MIDRWQRAAVEGTHECGFLAKTLKGCLHLTENRGSYADKSTALANKFEIKADSLVANAFHPVFADQRRLTLH